MKRKILSAILALSMTLTSFPITMPMVHASEEEPAPVVNTVDEPQSADVTEADSVDENAAPPIVMGEPEGEATGEGGFKAIAFDSEEDMEAYEANMESGIMPINFGGYGGNVDLGDVLTLKDAVDALLKTGSSTLLLEVDQDCPETEKITIDVSGGKTLTIRSKEKVGDLDGRYTISCPIVVKGDGKVIIQGFNLTTNGSSAIGFGVFASDSNSPEVELIDCNIRHEALSTGNTAAVYVQSEVGLSPSLKLTRSTVELTGTAGTDKVAAAIYVYGRGTPNLTVDRSTVTNHLATGGARSCIDLEAGVGATDADEQTVKVLSSTLDSGDNAYALYVHKTNKKATVEFDKAMEGAENSKVTGWNAAYLKGDGADVEFKNTNITIKNVHKSDYNNFGAFVFDGNNNKVTVDSTCTLKCTGAGEEYSSGNSYVGSFYSGTGNELKIEGEVTVEGNANDNWFSYGQNEGSKTPIEGGADADVEFNGTTTDESYAVYDGDVTVNVVKKFQEAVELAEANDYTKIKVVGSTTTSATDDVAISKPIILDPNGQTLTKGTNFKLADDSIAIAAEKPDGAGENDIYIVPNAIHIVDMDVDTAESATYNLKASKADNPYEVDVEIEATGIKPVEGAVEGGDVKAFWLGVGLIAPEGTTDVKYQLGDGTLTSNNGNGKPDPLYKDRESEAKNGFGFWFDAAKYVTEPNTVEKVTMQWTKSTDDVRTYTYNIKVTKVTLEAQDLKIYDYDFATNGAKSIAEKVFTRAEGEDGSKFPEAMKEVPANFAKAADGVDKDTLEEGVTVATGDPKSNWGENIMWVTFGDPIPVGVELTLKYQHKDVAEPATQQEITINGNGKAYTFYWQVPKFAGGYEIVSVEDGDAINKWEKDAGVHTDEDYEINAAKISVVDDSGKVYYSGDTYSAAVEAFNDNPEATIININDDGVTADKTAVNRPAKILVATGKKLDGEVTAGTGLTLVDSQSTDNALYILPDLSVIKGETVPKPEDSSVTVKLHDGAKTANEVDVNISNLTVQAGTGGAPTSGWLAGLGFPIPEGATDFVFNTNGDGWNDAADIGTGYTNSASDTDTVRGFMYWLFIDKYLAGEELEVQIEWHNNTVTKDNHPVASLVYATTYHITFNANMTELDPDVVFDYAVDGNSALTKAKTAADALELNTTLWPDGGSKNGTNTNWWKPAKSVSDTVDMEGTSTSEGLKWTDNNIMWIMFDKPLPKGVDPTITIKSGTRTLTVTLEGTGETYAYIWQVKDVSTGTFEIDTIEGGIHFNWDKGTGPDYNGNDVFAVDSGFTVYMGDNRDKLVEVYEDFSDAVDQVNTAGANKIVVNDVTKLNEVSAAVEVKRPVEIVVPEPTENGATAKSKIKAGHGMRIFNGTEAAGQPLYANSVYVIPDVTLVDSKDNTGGAWDKEKNAVVVPHIADGKVSLTEVDVTFSKVDLKANLGGAPSTNWWFGVGYYAPDGATGMTWYNGQEKNQTGLDLFSNVNKTVTNASDDPDCGFVMYHYYSEFGAERDGENLVRKSNPFWVKWTGADGEIATYNYNLILDKGTKVENFVPNVGQFEFRMNEADGKAEDKAKAAAIKYLRETLKVEDKLGDSKTFENDDTWYAKGSVLNEEDAVTRIAENASDWDQQRIMWITFRQPIPSGKKIQLTAQTADGTITVNLTGTGHTYTYFWTINADYIKSKYTIQHLNANGDQPQLDNSWTKDSYDKQDITAIDGFAVSDKDGKVLEMFDTLKAALEYANGNDNAVKITLSDAAKNYSENDALDVDKSYFEKPIIIDTQNNDSAADLASTITFGAKDSLKVVDPKTGIIYVVPNAITQENANKDKVDFDIGTKDPNDPTKVTITLKGKVGDSDSDKSPQDAWWVGIGVIAPDNLVEGSKVTYNNEQYDLDTLQDDTTKGFRFWLDAATLPVNGKDLVVTWKVNDGNGGKKDVTYTYTVVKGTLELEKYSPKVIAFGYGEDVDTFKKNLQADLDEINGKLPASAEMYNIDPDTEWAPRTMYVVLDRPVPVGMLLKVTMSIPQADGNKVEMPMWIRGDGKDEKTKNTRIFAISFTNANFNPTNVDNGTGLYKITKIEQDTTGDKTHGDIAPGRDLGGVDWTETTAKDDPQQRISTLVIRPGELKAGFKESADEARTEFNNWRKSTPGTGWQQGREPGAVSDVDNVSPRTMYVVPQYYLAQITDPEVTADSVDITVEVTNPDEKVVYRSTSDTVNLKSKGLSGFYFDFVGGGSHATEEIKEGTYTLTLYSTVNGTKSAIGTTTLTLDRYSWIAPPKTDAAGPKPTDGKFPAGADTYLNDGNTQIDHYKVQDDAEVTFTDPTDDDAHNPTSDSTTYVFDNWDEEFTAGANSYEKHGNWHDYAANIKLQEVGFKAESDAANGAVDALRLQPLTGDPTDDCGAWTMYVSLEDVYGEVDGSTDFTKEPLVMKVYDPDTVGEIDADTPAIYEESATERVKVMYFRFGDNDDPTAGKPAADGDSKANKGIKEGKYTVQLFGGKDNKVKIGDPKDITLYKVEYSTGTDGHFDVLTDPEYGRYTDSSSGDNKDTYTTYIWSEDYEQTDETLKTVAEVDTEPENPVAEDVNSKYFNGWLPDESNPNSNIVKYTADWKDFANLYVAKFGFKAKKGDTIKVLNKWVTDEGVGTFTGENVVDNMMFFELSERFAATNDSAITAVVYYDNEPIYYQTIKGHSGRFIYFCLPNETEGQKPGKGYEINEESAEKSSANDYAKPGKYEVKLFRGEVTYGTDPDDVETTLTADKEINQEKAAQGKEPALQKELYLTDVVFDMTGGTVDKEGEFTATSKKTVYLSGNGYSTDTDNIGQALTTGDSINFTDWNKHKANYRFEKWVSAPDYEFANSKQHIFTAPTTGGTQEFAAEWQLTKIEMLGAGFKANADDGVDAINELIAQIPATDDTLEAQKADNMIYGAFKLQDPASGDPVRYKMDFEKKIDGDYTRIGGRIATPRKGSWAFATFDEAQSQLSVPADQIEGAYRLLVTPMKDGDTPTPEEASEAVDQKFSIYKVVYDANYGTFTKDETIDAKLNDSATQYTAGYAMLKDVEALKPGVDAPKPTRPGYVFAGWMETAVSNDDNYTASYMAKWTSASAYFGEVGFEYDETKINGETGIIAKKFKDVVGRDKNTVIDDASPNTLYAIFNRTNPAEPTAEPSAEGKTEFKDSDKIDYTVVVKRDGAEMQSEYYAESMKVGDGMAVYVSFGNQLSKMKVNDSYAGKYTFELYAGDLANTDGTLKASNDLASLPDKPLSSMDITIYDITFDANGGTIGTGSDTTSASHQYAVPGNDLSNVAKYAPTTVTRPGYALAGWDTDYTLEGSQMLFKAQWMDAKADIVSVGFNDEADAANDALTEAVKTAFPSSTPDVKQDSVDNTYYMVYKLFDTSKNAETQYTAELLKNDKSMYKESNDAPAVKVGGWFYTADSLPADETREGTYTFRLYDDAAGTHKVAERSFDVYKVIYEAGTGATMVKPESSSLKGEVTGSQYLAGYATLENAQNTTNPNYAKFTTTPQNDLAPTKAGYSFLGWNTTPSVSTTAHTITYTASWAKNGVQISSVGFKKNKADGLSELVKAIGLDNTVINKYWGALTSGDSNSDYTSDNMMWAVIKPEGTLSDTTQYDVTVSKETASGEVSGEMQQPHVYVDAPVGFVTAGIGDELAACGPDFEGRYTFRVYDLGKSTTGGDVLASKTLDLYKVVYEGSTDTIVGYASDLDDVTTVNYPTKSAEPTKDGYQFAGWEETPVISGYTATFKAKWDLTSIEIIGAGFKADKADAEAAYTDLYRKTWKAGNNTYKLEDGYANMIYTAFITQDTSDKPIDYTVDLYKGTGTNKKLVNSLDIDGEVHEGGGYYGALNGLLDNSKTELSKEEKDMSGHYEFEIYPKGQKDQNRMVSKSVDVYKVVYAGGEDVVYDEYTAGYSMNDTDDIKKAAANAPTVDKLPTKAGNVFVKWSDTPEVDETNHRIVYTPVWSSNSAAFVEAGFKADSKVAYNSAAELYGKAFPDATSTFESAYTEEHTDPNTMYVAFKLATPATGASKAKYTLTIEHDGVTDVTPYKNTTLGGFAMASFSNHFAASTKKEGVYTFKLYEGAYETTGDLEEANATKVSEISLDIYKVIYDAGKGSTMTNDGDTTAKFVGYAMAGDVEDYVSKASDPAIGIPTKDGYAFKQWNTAPAIDADSYIAKFTAEWTSRSASFTAAGFKHAEQDVRDTLNGLWDPDLTEEQGHIEDDMIYAMFKLSTPAANGVPYTIKLTKDGVEGKEYSESTTATKNGGLVFTSFNNMSADQLGHKLDDKIEGKYTFKLYETKENLTEADVLSKIDVSIYKVVYDAGEGSDMTGNDAKTVGYATATDAQTLAAFTTEPPKTLTPTRPGYVFDGWNTVPSISTDDSYTATYTAKWAKGGIEIATIGFKAVQKDGLDALKKDIGYDGDINAAAKKHWAELNDGDAGMKYTSNNMMYITIKPTEGSALTADTQYQVVIYKDGAKISATPEKPNIYVDTQVGFVTASLGHEIPKNEDYSGKYTFYVYDGNADVNTATPLASKTIDLYRVEYEGTDKTFAGYAMREDISTDNYGEPEGLVKPTNDGYTFAGWEAKPVIDGYTATFKAKWNSMSAAFEAAGFQHTAQGAKNAILADAKKVFGDNVKVKVNGEDKDPGYDATDDTLYAIFSVNTPVTDHLLSYKVDIEKKDGETYSEDAITGVGKGGMLYASFKDGMKSTFGDDEFQGKYTFKLYDAADTKKTVLSTIDVDVYKVVYAGGDGATFDEFTAGYSMNNSEDIKKVTEANKPAADNVPTKQGNVFVKWSDTPEVDEANHRIVYTPVWSSNNAAFIGVGFDATGSKAETNALELYKQASGLADPHFEDGTADDTMYAAFKLSAAATEADRAEYTLLIENGEIKDLTEFNSKWGGVVRASFHNEKHFDKGDDLISELNSETEDNAAGTYKFKLYEGIHKTVEELANLDTVAETSIDIYKVVYDAGVGATITKAGVVDKKQSVEVGYATRDKVGEFYSDKIDGATLDKKGYTFVAWSAEPTIEGHVATYTAEWRPSTVDMTVKHEAGDQPSTDDDKLTLTLTPTDKSSSTNVTLYGKIAKKGVDTPIELDPIEVGTTEKPVDIDFASKLETFEGENGEINGEYTITLYDDAACTRDIASKTIVIYQVLYDAGESGKIGDGGQTKVVGYATSDKLYTFTVPGVSLETATRPGYVFDKWNTTPEIVDDAEVNAYTATFKANWTSNSATFTKAGLNESKQLYADFELSTPATHNAKYTVKVSKLNGDDYTEIERAEKTFDDITTKGNYYFDAKDLTGGDYQGKYKLELEADGKVVSTTYVEIYKVVYDANGGQFSDGEHVDYFDADNLEVGSKKIEPTTDPTKVNGEGVADDETFRGWNPPVDENYVRTYKAKWNAVGAKIAKVGFKAKAADAKREIESATGRNVTSEVSDNTMYIILDKPFEIIPQTYKPEPEDDEVLDQGTELGVQITYSDGSGYRTGTTMITTYLTEPGIVQEIHVNFVDEYEGGVHFWNPIKEGKYTVRLFSSREDVDGNFDEKTIDLYKVLYDSGNGAWAGDPTEVREAGYAMEDDYAAVDAPAVNPAQEFHTFNDWGTQPTVSAETYTATYTAVYTNDYGVVDAPVIDTVGFKMSAADANAVLGTTDSAEKTMYAILRNNFKIVDSADELTLTVKAPDESVVYTNPYKADGDYKNLAFAFPQGDKDITEGKYTFEVSNKAGQTSTSSLDIYKVVYDLNEGNISGDTNDVVSYAMKADIPEVPAPAVNPTREGFAFMGWSEPVATDFVRTFVAKWNSTTTTGIEAGFKADPQDANFAISGAVGIPVTDCDSNTMYVTFDRFTATTNTPITVTVRKDVDDPDHQIYTDTVDNKDVSAVYFTLNDEGGSHAENLEKIEGKYFIHVTGLNGTELTDEPIELTIYKVTYDYNGGSNLEIDDTYVDSRELAGVTATTEEPTLNGYDFAGWDDTTDEETFTRTFKATWEEQNVGGITFGFSPDKETAENNIKQLTGKDDIVCGDNTMYVGIDNRFYADETGKTMTVKFTYQSNSDAASQDVFEETVDTGSAQAIYFRFVDKPGEGAGRPSGTDSIADIPLQRGLYTVTITVAGHETVTRTFEMYEAVYNANHGKFDDMTTEKSAGFGTFMRAMLELDPSVTAEELGLTRYGYTFTGWERGDLVLDESDTDYYKVQLLAQWTPTSVEDVPEIKAAGFRSKADDAAAAIKDASKTEESEGIEVTDCVDDTMYLVLGDKFVATEDNPLTVSVTKGLDEVYTETFTSGVQAIYFHFNRDAEGAGKPENGDSPAKNVLEPGTYALTVTVNGMSDTVTTNVYEVTFADEDGTAYDDIAPVFVGEGEKAVYPETAPTKDGYTFKGWTPAEYTGGGRNVEVTAKATWELIPTPTPTAEPTPTPTVTPTAEPTVEPTVEPTTEPTTEPTVEPTTEPTTEPTVEPTTEPTTEPTATPTPAPTKAPTTHGGGGGFSGGGSGTTTYTVATPKPEDLKNGSVSVSPKTAAKGAKVTVTVKPNDGYTTGDVTVKDSNGNKVELQDNGDGTFTFTMPASKVTVEASFIEANAATTEPSATTAPGATTAPSATNAPSATTAPGEHICPSEKFVDVDQSLWYHESIDYALVEGLMYGMSDTIFAPDGTTTRAMIVSVLHRLEGTPAAPAASFQDVPRDAWYAAAVDWGQSTGVVSGYSDTAFGPEDPITREQMAAILYRYARYKGNDVTAQADLSGYYDAASVSDWAYTSVSWANAEGLIAGMSDVELAPTDTATRAQIAAILMRFCEEIVK